MPKQPESCAKTASNSMESSGYQSGGTNISWSWLLDVYDWRLVSPGYVRVCSCPAVTPKSYEGGRGRGAFHICQQGGTSMLRRARQAYWRTYADDTWWYYMWPCKQNVQTFACSQAKWLSVSNVLLLTLQKRLKVSFPQDLSMIRSRWTERWMGMLLPRLASPTAFLKANLPHKNKSWKKNLEN